MVKNTSISRAMVTTFSALMATTVLTVLPVLSLNAKPVFAAPQAAQPCVEDFTSDTDPTMPGFADSVFSHRAGLMTLNVRPPKTETSGPIAEASPTPADSPSAEVAKQTGTPASGSSPNPLPTVLPISSVGSIATVPNGATVIVNLNGSASTVRLEQWKVDGLSAQLIGLRKVQVNGAANSVSFDDLPAGVFQVRLWRRSNSGLEWTERFELKEHQVLQITIPSASKPSPQPTPYSSAFSTREAPDNSYILSAETRETRYFRDAQCPIKQIVAEYVYTSLKVEIVIIFRNGVERTASSDELDFVLAGKCLDIAQSVGFDACTPTPTPTPIPPRLIGGDQRTGVGVLQFFSVSLRNDEIIVGDAVKFNDQGNGCFGFLISGPGQFTFESL